MEKLYKKNQHKWNKEIQIKHQNPSLWGITKKEAQSWNRKVFGRKNKFEIMHEV